MSNIETTHPTKRAYVSKADVRAAVARAFPGRDTAYTEHSFPKMHAVVWLDGVEHTNISFDRGAETFMRARLVAALDAGSPK